jgi:hypothetical protein
MALTTQDCEPREDTPSPVPGVTGALRQPSLGVAEKILPRRSTAHTYDVSSVSTPAGCAGVRWLQGAAEPLPRRGSPAGGIPACARAGSMSCRRASA